MTKNFDHYITRNIRAFYKRRLTAPLIYIILLAVLWFFFPLSEIFEPKEFAEHQTLEAAYENGNRYVTTTVSDLTFTGYTSTRFGSTNGYFYYGNNSDGCFIVLLTPKTCEEGLPTIEEINIRCRIMKSNASYQSLLTNLAEDLDWTESGISSQLPGYYFSEPDFNPIVTTILFLFYYGSLIYSIICLAIYILYIFFPILSPPCQNLVVFGKPKRQLEEAEDELATLPQLATEDMFITEHYFILTSPYGNAIVPIEEILWIYKYSTLHKFLWYHFSISYTLHISANKHFYLQCPKNMKSDIDGIIDYLSEANKDILVGFTEKNRAQVEAIQGKPFHIEKIYAFLRKKI
jgi:hypothetical protein